MEIAWKKREFPVLLVRIDYKVGTNSPCSWYCEYTSRKIQALVLSYSMQGYTAEKGVVVQPGSSFFAGDYVALSRARDINKIILLGALIKNNFKDEFYDDIEAEYDRLRKKYNWWKIV